MARNKSPAFMAKQGHNQSQTHGYAQPMTKAALTGPHNSHVHMVMCCLFTGVLERGDDGNTTRQDGDIDGQLSRTSPIKSTAADGGSRHEELRAPSVNSVDRSALRGGRVVRNGARYSVE